MKRTIIGGLVAGGLMVGAAGPVIGAGLAKADPEFQIYGHRGDMNGYALAAEINAAGWTGENAAGAHSLAMQICGQRLAGWHEMALIGQLDDAYRG
ncbi:MAG: hypothetical protein ACXVX4_09830, partial [Mycobacterium sp.]